MAISLTRYVRITSGVGAGAVTPTRQLIARLFTTSTEVPTDSIAEFDTASGVGDYFGTNSPEHLRALYYFGFVGKNNTSPRLISFARWAETAVGATILGGTAATALATYQAITAGGFTVTLAGVDGAVTGLNLSSASSLADVATSMQTIIRAEGGTFANVTVTFNATRARFEFGSGNTGAEAIAITDGAETPLAVIGWADVAARLSPGEDIQTVTEVLTATTDVSNNFGTFLFLPTLTGAQFLEGATWNQAQNVQFIQVVPVTAVNAATMSTALIGFAGSSLELTDPGLSTEFPEMLMMAITASIDYARLNSVVNFMFHEDSRLTALVTTDNIASLYDPLRVNYIGVTQTAGASIEFYQRGFLTGGTAAPVSTNVYVNEMWFKDFTGAAFLDMFRNNGRISANAAGRAVGMRVIQSSINAALNNGTISVGRTLTNTEIEFIHSQTGDPNAYIEIQNRGFWYTVSFREDTVNGLPTQVLVYSLIYAKDEVVRSVDGRHILI